ncbi:MAG TPA: fibronectin type III domain-containing protein, partial [Syntrophales bacterium]|nr:fibronectin type III domain-containing protein [Syntrophales bacterium]
MTTKQNSCKNKGKNFYLFLIMGAVALVAFLMIVPLLVEAAHAADVTLEWDPSEGQDVNGYFLCYGMQSGDYSVSMDVGNATTSTVAGLEPGDTYYFAVYAYNSYG